MTAMSTPPGQPRFDGRGFPERGVAGRHLEGPAGVLCGQMPSSYKRGQMPSSYKRTRASSPPPYSAIIVRAPCAYACSGVHFEWHRRIGPRHLNQLRKLAFSHLRLSPVRAGGTSRKLFLKRGRLMAQAARAAVSSSLLVFLDIPAGVCPSLMQCTAWPLSQLTKLSVVLSRHQVSVRGLRKHAQGLWGLAFVHGNPLPAQAVRKW